MEYDVFDLWTIGSFVREEFSESELSFPGFENKPAIPLYIGLMRDDNTEVSSDGTGYERIKLDPHKFFKNDCGRFERTDAPYVFSTATKDWGNITGVVLFDSSVGGKKIVGLSMRTPRIVDGGCYPKLLFLIIDWEDILKKQYLSLANEFKL